jgi:glycosyltransferase involved in cell wall biosynthesis
MITVGIPTHNRAESLRETLLAISNLVSPESEWEVVVADNGSNDHTRDVCVEHLPANGRYVYEPHPGVSHARNRIVSESRGSLIVFTDDDTEPQAEWLRAYESASVEYPRASYFMGSTYWIWRSPQPWWYSEDPEHPITFCYRYKCEDGSIIPDSIAPAGPNMAIRRSVFEKVGGFNPQLGIVGDRKVGGEEPDLFCRARGAELHGRMVPGAVVGHRIYPSLIVLQSLLSNMLAAGVSDSLRADMYDSGVRLLQMPRWWMRSLVCVPIHHIVHAAKHCASREWVAVMHHILRMSYWIGRLRYFVSRQTFRGIRSEVQRRMSE